MKRIDWESLVGLAYDYAASTVEFTLLELAEHLDSSVDTCREVIRRLRHTFENDDINIVCTPDGVGPWKYRLVGTYTQAAAWHQNRFRDMGTRIDTLYVVARSNLNGSDRRTKEGRKAAAYEMELRHLKEKVAAIESDSAY